MEVKNMQKAPGYTEIEGLGGDVAATSRPLRTRNAGGRPPKALQDKATKLTIYVTESERTKINTRAGDLGITTSGLIRMLLKEKQLI